MSAPKFIACSDREMLQKLTETLADIRSVAMFTKSSAIVAICVVAEGAAQAHIERPAQREVTVASSRPNKTLIGERFKASIDRWISDRCPTGQFLQAVLENNLSGAIGRGDGEAIANIPHIVAYLYNDCDSRCWGSPAKVAAWGALAKARGEK